MQEVSLKASPAGLAPLLEGPSAFAARHRVGVYPCNCSAELLRDGYGQVAPKRLSALLTP